jgi:hypothetical protein
MCWSFASLQCTYWHAVWTVHLHLESGFLTCKISESIFQEPVETNVLWCGVAYVLSYAVLDKYGEPFFCYVLLYHILILHWTNVICSPCFSWLSTTCQVPFAQYTSAINWTLICYLTTKSPSSN